MTEEPVKFDEEIPLSNFFSFETQTELMFKMEYPLFDYPEIVIMNKDNHTQEEFEIAKNIINEEMEKLGKSRGRDIQQDYPDYEEFENVEYTFHKLRIGELEENKNVE